MRIFLLTLLVLVASCGKTNQLTGSKGSEAIEIKSFITIDHEARASLFRNKLLNSIVEERFPSTSNEYAVARYDELEGLALDEREFKSYKEKEQAMAKVVVSFLKRTEVYFIPEGILIETMASRLELAPEVQSHFKILKNDFHKTSRGETFYLVDVSYDELMRNDQLFFNKTYNLKDKFSSEKIQLKPFQKIELNVSYETYLQKLVASTLSKNGTRCTKGMTEAGMECGTCTYRRDAPSGEFAKAVDFPLENLGFFVKLNGRVVSLAELKNQKNKEGSFSVVIDEKETLVENAGLEIFQQDSASVTVQTNGYAYSSTCLSHSERGTSTLSSRVDFQVVLKVLGRGEELNKISL